MKPIAWINVFNDISYNKLEISEEVQEQVNFNLFLSFVQLYSLAVILNFFKALFFDRIRRKHQFIDNYIPYKIHTFFLLQTYERSCLQAKRNADNRVCIAEAEAIPLLRELLSSTDHRTQEHVVTALLSLLINESNKGTTVNA
jgi:hypothetical protein